MFNIFYSQAAKLDNVADRTGGLRHFASDYTGEQTLDMFLAETSQRGCDKEKVDVAVSIKLRFNMF